MTTAPPIIIQGIDHVVLRVRDMARMRQFYCDVIGCRVEKIQEALGLVQLRAGRSLIDLVDVAGTLGRMGGAPPSREGRNMDHLCLRIEPFDAAMLSAHLQAHGVTPGEVVSRYGAEGNGPSMYIADPEGNSIELKGPPTA
jgi:glyoxylase I family protein